MTSNVSFDITSSSHGANKALRLYTLMETIVLCLFLVFGVMFLFVCMDACVRVSVLLRVVKKW